MHPLETELESIRERLQDRLRELEQQLSPLQAEAARVRTQLEFLDKALAADATKPAAPDGIGTPNPRNLINGFIEKILSEEGQPLHISEIRRRYMAAGKEIPGQGTESNLLIYMIRDPRFAREKWERNAANSDSSVIGRANPSWGGVWVRYP